MSTATAAWDLVQVAEFAKGSAVAAIDAWQCYGSVRKSIHCNRINLADTLAEYHASHHLDIARRIYDDVLIEIFTQQMDDRRIA